MQVMNTIENVKSIKICERTKQFLTIKAELSEIYRHLCDALQDVDPKCQYEQTQKLRNAFLDTDEELMRYITGLMEEQMLISDYSLL